MTCIMNLIESRLAERDYELDEEKVAFRQGYSDGYNGRTMWAATMTREHQRWPNAYSAGFWIGVDDARK